MIGHPREVPIFILAAKNHFIQGKKSPNLICASYGKIKGEEKEERTAERSETMPVRVPSA